MFSTNNVCFTVGCLTQSDYPTCALFLITGNPSNKKNCNSPTRSSVSGERWSIREREHPPFDSYIRRKYAVLTEGRPYGSPRSGCDCRWASLLQHSLRYNVNCLIRFGPQFISARGYTLAHITLQLFNR